MVEKSIVMLVFKDLVVSTHLKNTLVKMGIFPQVGMNKKKLWNHHLVIQEGSNRTVQTDGPLNLSI